MTLMFVSLTFVDINKCKLTDYKKQTKIAKICVGEGDGKDSCAGDSG